ncbi:MAG TPA: conjugal transfer protein TrbD [Candidatus Competibacteraceae bacterium]|nr:conjugal transfer protein TrbD [Candidatus Competibacteraceae bacterium]
MTAPAVRAIPLHRALIRPILLLGAERELVLSTALLAAGLIFSVHQWWSAVLGGGLWLVGLAALQRMAKADPLLSQTLARHLRYQPWYPARATPFAKAWRK